MYTWDEMVTANAGMKTTPIKGKKYIEVNERIKAFRSLCPHGAIITEMVSNENGICVFRASVYDEEQKMIGTGYAYEKENSSNINKTSYIENCETSAVGRALGMCGFGIDTSIASAEEVQNAIEQQSGITDFRTGLTPRQQLFAILKEKGIDATEFAQTHNIDKSTPEDVIIDIIKDLE